MEATNNSIYPSKHGHTTGSIAGSSASLCTEYFQTKDQETLQETLIKTKDICNGFYKNIPLYTLYSESDIMERACKGAYTTLVESINDDTVYWKDLVINLGISLEELKCIEIHTNNRMEATKMMLEFYMRRYYDDATFGKILAALYKIERYDVILKLELDFKEIGQHLSGPTSENNDEIPTLIDKIPNNLPETLRKKIPIKDKKERKRIFPLILLTFAEDGSTIARNIKETNKWCKINTLEDLKNQIIVNPRPNIKEYVKMVDFVVPIVTEGYLNAIEATEQTVQNPKYQYEPLDYKYVKFIYELVMSDPSNLWSVYFCDDKAALYRRIISRREFNTITPVDTFHAQINAYWKLIK